MVNHITLSPDFFLCILPISITNLLKSFIYFSTLLSPSDQDMFDRHIVSIYSFFAANLAFEAVRAPCRPNWLGTPSMR